MGDHKAIVMDIPYQYILGEQLLKVVHTHSRRIQCGLTGPKCWYLQNCETLFQEHKVYSKARGLYISRRYPPPPKFTEKLKKWIRRGRNKKRTHKTNVGKGGWDK